MYLLFFLVSYFPLSFFLSLVHFFFFFFCEILQCKAFTSPSRDPYVFFKQFLSLLVDQKPEPTCQIALLLPGTTAAGTSDVTAGVHCSKPVSVAGEGTVSFLRNHYGNLDVPAWQHRGTWKDHSLVTVDLVNHCLVWNKILYLLSHPLLNMIIILSLRLYSEINTCF